MKKFAAAVSVLLLVGAGYFFGHGGSTGAEVKNIEKNIEKSIEAPQQIINVQKEGLGPNKYINAYITRVTDGDTLEITYKSETYKVRLLCVDTPESVKQGVPVQPFSKEASEFTKETVLNQSVRLVFDKGFQDRYGRLLAYVFLKDNTFLNAILVRNGFARVEIVSPNGTYADFFYNLQQKAIDEKRGMWALPVNKQPFVKSGDKTYKARYQVDG